MVNGQVISRNAFLELCAKNKAPEDMIEIFKKDQRENNTVLIILICEGIFRLIWLGFTEEELERARQRKPTVSSLVRYFLVWFIIFISFYFSGSRLLG